MTRFTNTSWHFKHLLYTKALHSHATASEDWGRTKVKVCPFWRTAVSPVQPGENRSHYFTVGPRTVFIHKYTYYWNFLWKSLREIFTFRTLVGFPSDDGVLHTEAWIYVISKIGLWNADRRIDNLPFESFMVGITAMCYKNNPGELIGLQFHYSKWYTSVPCTSIFGMTHLVSSYNCGQDFILLS